MAKRELHNQPTNQATAPATHIREVYEGLIRAHLQPTIDPHRSIYYGHKVNGRVNVFSIVFQDNVDLGDLMFSLCYLPTAGRLTITMIKARNLKAMDITGASGN